MSQCGCMVNQCVYMGRRLHGEQVCLHDVSVSLMGQCSRGEQMCLHGESVCLRGESVCLYGESVCLRGESVCLHGEQLCLHGESVCLRDEQVWLVNRCVKNTHQKTTFFKGYVRGFQCRPEYLLRTWCLVQTSHR